MAVETESEVRALLARLEAFLDRYEPLLAAYVESLGGKAAAWNIRRKARRDER